jgi:predicted phosphodiesterase
MRIGIVADIHNDAGSLKKALAEFQSRGVDQVVSLGDACDTFGARGTHDDLVVDLLRSANAIGVWGNHDIGLCYHVSENIRSTIDAAALEYLAGMQPYLRIGDCHFSHVEPWLDARNVEDLWYFEGPPDTPEKARRSFDAVAERHVFVGHFHCWLVMTQAGRVDWDGQEPIRLSDALRYLVVIAPVFNGWCATFDTASSLLTPISCGQ